MLLFCGCAHDPTPVLNASDCKNTPKLETQALIARDCAELAAQVWRANRPRGGIVMLHNFGDFHAAFEQLAPRFVEAGYTVLAYDQRGFGQSGERGRWYGQDKLIHDAQDAVAVLKDELGTERPIYLLGESMGGSVALILATQRNQIDGLILAGPGVREGIDYRWFWDAALWTGAALAPGFTVSNPRGDNEALTPAASERLSQSPNVVTQVRLDTYDALIDLTDAASEAAYAVTRPTLLLYGALDETVAPIAIKNARLALSNATYHEYPGAPHLLFQSESQDKALADTIDWLSKMR